MGMGELHPIGEGKHRKLVRAHEAGRLTDAVTATAGFIVQREEMIARGDPQEAIDFVTHTIEDNLSRRTDEEKRLIELTATEIRNLRVQGQDNIQE